MAPVPPRILAIIHERKEWEGDGGLGPNSRCARGRDGSRSLSLSFSLSEGWAASSKSVGDGSTLVWPNTKCVFFFWPTSVNVKFLGTTLAKVDKIIYFGGRARRYPHPTPPHLTPPHPTPFGHCKKARDRRSATIRLKIACGVLLLCSALLLRRRLPYTRAHRSVPEVSLVFLKFSFRIFLPVEYLGVTMPQDLAHLFDRWHKVWPVCTLMMHLLFRICRRKV